MRRLLSFAAATLFCASPWAPAFAMAGSPEEWPTFKGDPGRLGRGPKLTPPVREVWRVRLKGSLYSSPALAEGRLLLGSSSRKVYALDAATGAELWSSPLPDRVWGSAPAVDSRRVFVGCVDGCVYGLSLDNGAVLGTWCAQRKGLLGERPDVLSSPLVVDNRLFFGSDNHDIYGWDLAGRREQWRYKTGDILHDNAAAFAAGAIYMPSRDRRLYCLDAATGALRWSFEAPKPFNTTPASDGVSVWVGNGDGRLYCLDAATGALRWSFESRRGIMSSPAVAPDGGIYFGSADGFVYALGPDGLERWRRRTGGVVLASPLLTGELLWIGSYDGRFYALDAATGAERWSTELENGVFCAPAVSGRRVYVAGRGGEVLCVEAAAPVGDPAPGKILPPEKR